MNTQAATDLRLANEARIVTWARPRSRLLGHVLAALVGIILAAVLVRFGL